MTVTGTRPRKRRVNIIIGELKIKRSKLGGDGKEGYDDSD